MLIWVAALHCEAKPIIDYYRLKKSPHHRAFDLYQNDSMQCVISGIGKTSSAAATAWIAALNHQQVSIGWINLGIAGAAEKIIGDIFRLNKITDNQHNRNHYPVPTFASGLPSTSCITLDQASNDYHADAIFDMEASGFFATATRFSTAELVHCIKIISDNRQRQTGFDKPAISKLIQDQLEVITDFAQKLQALSQQLIDLEFSPDQWQQVLQQAHFSQTQQARLKTLLRFLHNNTDQDKALIDGIAGLNSGRSIIAKLEQDCYRLTRNL